MKNMSKENHSEENLFILNRLYKNPEAILSRKIKSIDDIFKTAIFVLDTNSLLAPFQTGKDDIEEIRLKYENLIFEERLFIHRTREISCQ